MNDVESHWPLLWWVCRGCRAHLDNDIKIPKCSANLTSLACYLGLPVVMVACSPITQIDCELNVEHNIVKYNTFP